ncbi:hypothetical protein CULT_1530007 [[Clostridium] ultunense Esp]|uniref:Uncharacterized protein n=1 Tax=[Clostridium] ultunense Esp TaxID=1288971 RepID=M1Z7Y8_9FIRM|nr:hypothetical protein [Schnuerera ultunensis]CCQ93854.1 hypothetical protein CULT_1530007 [[Clostridium] ultunense Esp]SHD76554.1 conserved protein of unknown function [[Clostridium] ultunense Esp]
MLLYGCKTLILRCHFCARLREYELNLFHIRGGNKIEYKCECGETNITFIQKNKGIDIFVNCFNCGNKHYYNLDLHTILKDDNIIYCFCGTEALYLGSKNMAKRFLLGKSIGIGSIDNDKTSKDFFNNFKVLAKILSILYGLKMENKISCSCGNSQINIELFSDRIELECLNCHSVKIIFAETEDDLSVLSKKDKIILEEKNISCIDSIKEKNRDIKK